jgi:hypothetical protein
MKNYFEHSVRRFSVLLIMGMFYSPGAFSEQRLLMSHAGMDAYLNSLECRSSQQAALEIRSSSAHVFDGDRIELQRLIGQVRAVISIECPEIRRMTAKGTVSNQLYFAGATDKSWGWKIIGLYAAPKSK